jgi:hypothetical protein
VAFLAAGGGEAGGDFVSDCVQGFAMATPQFSQDHSRTDLTFGAVVRGGDVGVVQKQEPLVAVMSQVFRQALDVSVPLRFASHLRQLPFQLRGPPNRVRQPSLRFRNPSVPFATPRTRRQ